MPTVHGYRLSASPIGTGGQAKVYRATRIGDGAVRACKSLPVPRDRAALALVDNEIVVTKRVQGRHVPRLYQVVTDDAGVHLMLQFCAGGDLVGKQLGDAEARRMARGILRACARAHALGIAHMDVKPANVLLNTDGEDEYLLCDWGISRTSSTKPAYGAAAKGSPVYCAPETLRSIYTSASDVWSVGTTVYQVLAGRHPFYHRGISTDTLWRNMQRGVPPSNEIGADARDFLGQCLVPNFFDRATCEDLLSHTWLA